MDFWVYWIIAAIGFAILEMFTATFFVIWFSAGSIVALLFSFLDVPIQGQIFSFVLTSTILVVYTRPLAKKYLEPKGDYKSNVNSLKGSEAVVTKEIHSMDNSGQVKLKGEYWLATTNEKESIPVDTIVEIEDVKGVTLKVITKK